MTSLWQVVVALLVTVPIGAYAAGTLISNAPAERDPRPPVVLRDATPNPTPTVETPAPIAPSPTRPPRQPPPPQDDDDQVRVLTPQPTRVGDDDDDDSGTSGERDDDDGDDPSRDDSSESRDD